MRLKSRQALREFMEFHKIGSAYELARRADLKVGIVGHIVSGRRTTCSAKTAGAIERALECPPGFLFVAKMSQVSDDMRHMKEAA